MPITSQVTKILENDIREFLVFAIDTRQRLLRSSLQNIKSVDTTFDFKVGATYRSLGIDLKEKIWKNLSVEIDGILKQQEIAEDTIYKRFLLMKKEHEALLKRKIPPSWYQKAIKIIAENNTTLDKKINTCIQAYKDLAIEIEQRCNKTQYPHDELVDGRDFIKLSKNMDIETFRKTLLLREMFEDK